MRNSSSILLKLSIVFSITLHGKPAYETFVLILLTSNWIPEKIVLVLRSFSVTEYTLDYQYIGYFDFFQNTYFLTSLFPLVISVSKNFVRFFSTVNFMFRWYEFKASKDLLVSSRFFGICIVYIVHVINWV